MGAKNKAAKAGAAAVALRQSPYVKRIAEDEELRTNLWTAYESGRAAVSRLADGKSPGKVIFDDKRFQKDVRAAAENFRDASVALREPKKRKGKGGLGLGKLILLAIVSAAVALAVSEGLRKKVLDALFGAEEEFEYTSTTTPPAGGSDVASQPAGTTT